jgi:cytochrome c-type biogenesis protein CcmH/NrfF
VHESELATSLRAEIHERLRRGEPDAIIEDDLAIRFGERIRAVPRGHDPRGAVPLLVGMGMILSAAGLFWLLRRWSRRPSHPPDSRPAMPAGDEYEARLDDELRRLDEP